MNKEARFSTISLLCYHIKKGYYIRFKRSPGFLNSGQGFAICYRYGLLPP